MCKLPKIKQMPAKKDSFKMDPYMNTDTIVSEMTCIQIFILSTTAFTISSTIKLVYITTMHAIKLVFNTIMHA